MARKLTHEQIETIRATKGLPVRDIARRAGVSLASVSKTLNAPAPAKAPKAPPKAPTAPAEGEPGPDASPLERLTRAVKSLEHAAQVAAGEGDQARVVAALRAVSDVTRTIAALTPPPAVDHDAHPDMVQAAKECREAIFGLFDRIVAEGASK